MRLKRLRERIPSYHFKWQMGLCSVESISSLSCVNANHSYQQVLKFYCNVQVVPICGYSSNGSFKPAIYPCMFHTLTLAFVKQAGRLPLPKCVLYPYLGLKLISGRVAFPAGWESTNDQKRPCSLYQNNDLCWATCGRSQTKVVPPKWYPLVLKFFCTK